MKLKLWNNYLDNWIKVNRIKVDVLFLQQYIYKYLQVFTSIYKY